MILVESRKLPELLYENTKLMLFPDFSADVQNRHRSFNEVRRRLREKNIMCREKVCSYSLSGARKEAYTGMYTFCIFCTVYYQRIL